MTIIRQPSLFSIQELYDMEPTQKYDAIRQWDAGEDLFYHYFIQFTQGISIRSLLNQVYKYSISSGVL